MVDVVNNQVNIDDQDNNQKKTNIFFLYQNEILYKKCNMILEIMIFIG